MSKKDKYPHLAWMKAGDIRRAEWNPRELPARSEGKAGESLDHFGWLQPLTWNAKTKTLLDGHMRLEDVADDADVPVYCVWLTEDKEKLGSVALNNNFGTWVDNEVAKNIKSLSEEQVEVDLAGFGNETGKYLFFDDWKEDREAEEREAEEFADVEKRYSTKLEWDNLADKITWERFVQRAGTIDAVLEAMKGWEYDQ